MRERLARRLYVQWPETIHMTMRPSMPIRVVAGSAAVVYANVVFFVICIMFVIVPIPFVRHRQKRLIVKILSRNIA